MLSHVGNVLFVAGGGHDRPQLPIRIDQHRAAPADRLAVDARHEGAGLTRAYTDGAALPRHPRVPNGEVARSRRLVVARLVPEGDVITPRGVVERSIARGAVITPALILKERLPAAGGVIKAGGIELERP